MSNDTQQEWLTDLLNRVYVAGYKAGHQETGLLMVVAGDVILPAALAEINKRFDEAVGDNIIPEVIPHLSPFISGVNVTKNETREAWYGDATTKEVI